LSQNPSRENEISQTSTQPTPPTKLGYIDEKIPLIKNEPQRHRRHKGVIFPRFEVKK
jgi:hypothetical protein